jgi:anthranilate phosphoribosyltransferase
MNTDEFIQYLKKKGTGPTMSKSLSEEELGRVSLFFDDPDLPLVTKATMLTAMVLLDATPAEADWLAQTRADLTGIPQALRWLLTGEATSDLESAVLAIVRGEELSGRDADRWMESLFDPAVPACGKAALLESLRLRRETEIENKAALAACLRRTSPVSVNLPVVIDISNAYDGFNRNLFLAPFVAAVLAAMGFPTVVHGMDEVSPKKGVNARKILTRADKRAVRSPEMIVEDLTTVGWTYADQSVFCPALYALKPLRLEMVKRPILATVEKLLLPVRGAKTFVVTGYTHPPYKGKTVTLLNCLPIAGGIIVRGLEGSTQLPLDRRAPQMVVRPGQAPMDGFIRPEDVGLETEEDRILPDTEITIGDCLDAGVAALNGESGLASRMIRYQAAQIVATLGLADRPLARVDDVISSGEALRRWQCLK